MNDLGDGVIVTLFFASFFAIPVVAVFVARAMHRGGVRWLIAIPTGVCAGFGVMFVTILVLTILDPPTRG